MALGLARIFGIELPWNFDRPYRSASPTEFWRRWHVTLSTWLRDYLYIPLGGNRKGERRRDVEPLRDDGARRPLARRVAELRRAGASTTARLLIGHASLAPARAGACRARSRSPSPSCSSSSAGCCSACARPPTSAASTPACSGCTASAAFPATSSRTSLVGGAVVAFLPEEWRCAGRRWRRAPRRRRRRAVRRVGRVRLHEPPLHLLPLLMRRLVLFLGSSLALLGAAAAFNWWVDPFGDIYKPGALADAMQQRPTASSRRSSSARATSRSSSTSSTGGRRGRFVVGSSRVLKIAVAPGRAIVLEPRLPRHRARDDPRPVPRAAREAGADRVPRRRGVLVQPAATPCRCTARRAYDIAQYLLSRATFQFAFRARAAGALHPHATAGGETQVGRACVIGRIFPSIAWKVDGSRVWSWELDPKRVRAVPAAGVHGRPRDLSQRLLRTTGRRSTSGGCACLEQALAARADSAAGTSSASRRPSRRTTSGSCETDPQLAAALAASSCGRCRRSSPGTASLGRALERARGRLHGRDFPDGFHTNAACSARVRARLDAARHR